MAATTLVLITSVLVRAAVPAAAQEKAAHPAAPLPAKAPELAALARKAAAAREAGRADEAISLYKQALARNPDWAEGRWYLGTLLYEKEAFAEARESLRMLVALTPRAGPAWAMLGLSEFRLKDNAVALTHLEKGRDLGLGGNEALIQVTRYHIAVLLTRFKAFPNATDILVSLARSRPESDELALALGLNILKRPLLPSEVPASDRALVLQAGHAAYLQAVGRHVEARHAFESLRADGKDEPGVSRTYRDYLAAYPKALSEPKVREEAIAELRTEVAAAPRDFEGSFYLALLLRDGAAEEAASLLETARTARPDAVEPAYELARLRLAAGRTDDARELLEGAVARDPDFAAAHVLLASVYYRLDRKADGDRARAAARKADESVAVAEGASTSTAPASAAPASASGKFEKVALEAAAARDGNRLVAAVDAYRQGLVLRPSWDEGLWYLGTILYDLDRTDEAKAAFLRLVNLKPEGGAGWAYLGLCEFRSKDYGASLQHLERGRMLGLGGNESLVGTVRYYVAILLTRRSEFEMALQILSAFAVAGNQSPSVIEALGAATLRLPRLPSEIAEAKKKVVLAVGRAAFDQAARRFAEARRGYEELLRQYPTEPNLHYAYGVFLLGQEPDLAMDAFREEIRLQPGQVFARLHLAFEFFKRGDSKAALPEAKEAVRLDPKSFAARNALGRALLDEGDVQGAIVQLEEGARLAPDSPEMQFALARAYTQAGRKDEAGRAREEFRRLDEIRKAAVKATAEESAIRKPGPDSPP